MADGPALGFIADGQLLALADEPGIGGQVERYCHTLHGRGSLVMPLQEIGTGLLVETVGGIGFFVEVIIRKNYAAVQPAFVCKSVPGTQIDVGFRLVGKHIALQPHLRAFTKILPEAHQLPLVGAVEILGPLNIQQKAVLVITKTEILAVAKIEILSPAADTAPSTTNAVVRCGR